MTNEFNNFSPVCAVILDMTDPGAEFESLEEARQYALSVEREHGRSGENKEFPAVVSYRDSYRFCE